MILIPPRELARLLYEELEGDAWGDIDPWWLKLVAIGDDCRGFEEAEMLLVVLERVCERINRGDFDG